MHSPKDFSRNIEAAIVLAALLCFTAGLAQSQTFTVLHDFGGGEDGGTPYSGLIFDRAGNLYGTAHGGGT